jgi:iron complex outermembrane receptor protein
MAPQTRTATFAFLQDEWELGRDWTCTLGLRQDRDHQFGSTANPRLGLVWTVNATLTWKAMAGTAFRAPTFAELYTRNNPVAQGNPQLLPERLRMVETALFWRAAEALQVEVTAYRFLVKDFIQFEKDAGLPTFTARNAGRQVGQGVELGLLFAPAGPLRIQAHGSYQDTRNPDTGAPIGEAPRGRAFLRVDWNPISLWQGDLQVTRVGPRPRPLSDPRADLRGFTTVDAALRRERFLGRFTLSLILRNAFDADVREPSQAPNPGAAFVDIPNDLPQAGRSVLVELAWRSR